MKYLFFFFLTISQTFASSAKIEFLAPTNMPGVQVEGEVQVSDAVYNATALEKSHLKFDVFDMKTGMDKRDEHLREKVFSAHNRGEVLIEFLPQKKVCAADKCQLQGLLKIKGVSKEISLPLENSIGFKGETTVALSDFQLPRPGFMGVKVEDQVKIKFELVE